jgi:hypothetical protein
MIVSPLPALGLRNRYQAVVDNMMNTHEYAQSCLPGSPIARHYQPVPKLPGDIRFAFQPLVKSAYRWRRGDGDPGPPGAR